MRDAGHDGAAAGPKTSGSLTGTAKLTSSNRYADIISKVSGPVVVSSCGRHSRAAIIPASQWRRSPLPQTHVAILPAVTP